MDNLLFSINAVLPVFIIVFVGIFLKKKNIINDNFVKISTDVVFKVALPALVFQSIATTDFKSVFDIRVILYTLVSITALFFILCLAGKMYIPDRQSRGAFIQGVFRSNYAIIGLQLISNLFGQTGVAKSAVVLAFTMPLYNVLAVCILTMTSPKKINDNKKEIFINILKNPLIIASALALPFSYFRIPLPGMLLKSIDYLSALSMPLALFGMGAFFSFENVKRNLHLSLTATVLKIAVTPLIFTLLAYALGFRKEELGVICMVFASPTAVSSYIMARAMDSDSDLAANIVLMSTLGSILTIFAGIYLLKAAGAI